MKDVERLARSTAQHLVASAALAVAARSIENRQPKDLTKELIQRLQSKARNEAQAAIDIFVAHRDELELFMSMPPINPS